ncbi:sensor histidine kinase [Deinococcus hopiensis]|uniref:histidine kinase n=1 Tax=Deinococcus hopiensis KR-140 TaxID=695939 RepID=A0A1W1UTJ4_9DEIO|nr:ATP-binding protein [Deinococcus hopiensis]SMB84376.1 PAS domain S-box-containing protein [Deinococcus hopiensis KR-140]
MNDQKNEQAQRKLREQAELKLEDAVPEVLPLVETPEALRHELSVRQIELELQNEELQRTVQKLQEAHEKYVGLYDFAPVGYFTLDGNGAIVQANLRASRMLGAEGSRLLGRRLAQFTAPDSRTTLAHLLARLHASQEELVAELRLQRGDGSTFPVRLEGQAYAPAGSLVAVTDITTEKAAQEDLLRLNETLEARVAERTAKIRELSTELRIVAVAVAEDLMAPLRRVASFGELLKRDVVKDSEASLKHLELISRSVGQMEELTTALLEYTRASHGRLRLTPLDLNRVFSEVLKDLRPQMEGRKVSLTSGLLPTVQGDSNAMQQVFLEMLRNALKFTATREEAQIHVRAEETEAEFILRFEDNGVGFNNRHKDKLFQVFKRLHPESAFPGTGMGLAVVRRICTRFGGRVWGEGRVNEGATLFLAWPKQPHVLD